MQVKMDNMLLQGSDKISEFSGLPPQVRFTCPISKIAFRCLEFTASMVRESSSASKQKLKGSVLSVVNPKLGNIHFYRSVL